MSSIYIARNPRAPARAFDGEMIVISAETSMVFSLNVSAAALWEAADGVTPLQKIVEEKICAEYDVEADVAHRDAEEVVKQMAEHGILLTSSEPIAFSEVRP
jgi:Coenzyme PQQ synthesis protein D (PqqD)